MAFKFSLSHFKAPTPRVWRQIGNALFGVSTGIALPVAVQGNVILAYTIVGIGGVGKFLSDFFKDDPEQPDPQSSPNKNT